MNKIHLADNYLLYILLSAAILLVFAYSWVSGGLDVDSCNYAAVSKEVFHTNKWLGMYDPVYGGVFYYHFPLCIWISALLFKFLGISTFTAKFFSMSSAVALTGIIFYFGKLLKNQWVGFFAGMSFLMTNHIVRLSRQCRMDIPVTLFITLAVFYFFMGERRSRLNYLLFGIFTSLAIFTKDIFGIAPLAIIFIYLLLRLDWKRLVDPLFLAGIVFAFLPVLFWIWLDHSALFSRWWSWNFMHLFKSPSFTVPWYYYIKAILSKYFYFFPFAAYGGYLIFKEARENKRHEPYLLVIWALIFPIAFSFGRQKLHYFILPMYPAASLMTGLALDKLIKEPFKIKFSMTVKYILIGTALTLLCFPLKIQSKRFIETVKLAPFMDEILKQRPELEFIAYNQDVASLLFYSQRIRRVESITDKAKLESSLGSKEKFLCYINEQDFQALSPAVLQNCRVVLKYKGKLVVASQKDRDFSVSLPDFQF